MTDRQKKIEELKRSLLAPQPKRIKKEESSSNKQEEFEDKYKRVMDWGTPRLVTKNR